MANIGISVGVFVFPIISELLLDSYSLWGYFLLTGGMIMNILPLSILLVPKCLCKIKNTSCNLENCTVAVNSAESTTRKHKKLSLLQVTEGDITRSISSIYPSEFGSVLLQNANQEDPIERNIRDENVLEIQTDNLQVLKKSLHTGSCNDIYLFSNALARQGERAYSESDSKSLHITEPVLKSVQGKEKTVEYGQDLNTNECITKKEKSHFCLLMSLKGFPFLCILTVFCTQIMGCFYTFIVAMAEERNIAKTYGNILLSVSGIADLLANFIVPPIFDLPYFTSHRSLVYSMVSFFTGAFFAIIPFCHSFIEMTIVVFLCSFCISQTHTLRIPVGTNIIKQSKDVDLLPSAVGGLTFCMGTGHALGPTVGGEYNVINKVIINLILINMSIFSIFFFRFIG